MLRFVLLLLPCVQALPISDLQSLIADTKLLDEALLPRLERAMGPTKDEVLDAMKEAGCKFYAMFGRDKLKERPLEELIKFAVDACNLEQFAVKEEPKCGGRPLDEWKQWAEGLTTKERPHIVSAGGLEFVTEGSVSAGLKYARSLFEVVPFDTSAGKSLADDFEAVCVADMFGDDGFTTTKFDKTSCKDTDVLNGKTYTSDLDDKAAQTGAKSPFAFEFATLKLIATFPGTEDAAIIWVTGFNCLSGAIGPFNALGREVTSASGLDKALLAATIDGLISDSAGIAAEGGTNVKSDHARLALAILYSTKWLTSASYNHLMQADDEWAKKIDPTWVTAGTIQTGEPKSSFVAGWLSWWCDEKMGIADEESGHFGANWKYELESTAAKITDKRKRFRTVMTAPGDKWRFRANPYYIKPFEHKYEVSQDDPPKVGWETLMKCALPSENDVKKAVSTLVVAGGQAAPSGRPDDSNSL